MPSDDVILNLRQIAGFPQALGVAPTDMVVMQRGGLGGPYLSMSPASLVATALMSGGDMVVGGQLQVGAIQGGALQMSNGTFGLLNAQKSCFTDADFQWATIQGAPVATQTYVDLSIASLGNATVWTFNGRRGDVLLNLNDVTCAGGAPIFSPRLQGFPRAETPAPWSNNTRLATTGFVHRNSVEYISNLLRDHPFVFSFNGRTGEVTLQPGDIQLAEAALLDSPPLTGTPTAPTAPAGTNTDQLATTQFVTNAITTALAGEPGTLFAPLNSPQFSGYPTAPTANPGTSTAQLATTAFVMAAVAASVTGVATWNTRTGNVTLELADVTGVGGAPLASPTFTGDVLAPTVAVGDNSNRIATTAWVLNELGGAAVGVMSFNGRDGAVTLNTSDITSAGGAPAASPTFTGMPLAPTAATGTSTDQLATTAFVMSAVTQGSVTTFNGRIGAITLTANDVTAAGGLANPSPAITGTPTAPTAAAGTNSTQIATTAFVAAAISGLSIPAASTTTPLMDGTASVGNAITWARANHVHPTDTSLAPLSALANYLPLSGGTLTAPGALSVTSLQVAQQYFGLQVDPNGNATLGFAQGTVLAWSPTTLTFAFVYNSGIIVVIGTDGSATFGGPITVGGWGVRFTSPFGAATSNFFGFNWTGTQLNAIVNNNYVGAIAFQSDYRIKKGVKPLASMWDRVKALKPVSYSHKKFRIVEDDDAEHWGFAAHELQETLTESAASGVKDGPDMQSPNPWTVIAALTRALQEAMGRIERLEAAT